MKASQCLALLATLSTALAGPVKHAKFHARNNKHSHYPHISANTTASYSAGAGNSSAYGSPSPYSYVAPAAVPVTSNAASLSIIGSSGSTTTAYVHSTETRTDTITNTVTLTIGSGAGAVTSTTTSISYEIVEVIVKYVTVYVTDYQTVPAPTAAASPDLANTGAGAYTTAVAPSGGAAVEPSTPADESGDGTTTADGASGDDATTTGGYGDEEPSTTTDVTTAGPTYANMTAPYIPALKDGKTTPAANKKTSSKSSSKATTTVKKTTTPAAVKTVPAPTQTGAGTVTGCTKWYVAKPGDYCYLVATNNGVDTNTFISWNPSVGSTCATMYPNFAYCIAISGSAAAPSSGTATPDKERTTTTKSTTMKTTTVQSSASATQKTYSSSSSSAQPVSPASSTLSYAAPSPTATGTSPPASGDYSYHYYSGDGTTAAGWPAQSEWVSFEDMWTFNLPIMQQSCSEWNAQDDTTDETNYMKSAIQQVAASSGVDARFILAIIMQESNGCVRVITTKWSVENPGLMQTHAGTGTCYPFGGSPTFPCPDSMILQMIEDGTTGTAAGDGLKQCLAETGVTSATDVSMYYKAARIYNGGQGSLSNDLGTGCCTPCYASDVANRLRGWHSGSSSCPLAA